VVSWASVCSPFGGGSCSGPSVTRAFDRPVAGAVVFDGGVNVSGEFLEELFVICSRDPHGPDLRFDIPDGDVFGDDRLECSDVDVPASVGFFLRFGHGAVELVADMP